MDAIKFLKTAQKICKSHYLCSRCEINSYCTNEARINLYGFDCEEKNLCDIVEKWAKEHPAGEQHKTEERYIKLTPDSVEFVATAGKKTRSLKIVEQATEKYDSILAVLREYAPPDEIAYYLEHGETKGQMLQRIENSVTVEECGFEK